MLELHSTLYIIAISLCLFSAGILQNRARRSGTSYVFFNAFLGIEALCFVFEWLMIQPEVPYKALWLSLLIAVSFLSAPCLWLATIELMTGTMPRLQKLHWGHYLVITVGLLLILPLLETAHAGYAYISPDHTYTAAYGFFIHSTMVLAVGVYCCQVPFYLRRSLHVLRGTGRQPGVYLAQPVRWLMIMISATWILSMIRTLVVIAGPFQISRLAIASGDVVVTICSLYIIVSKFSPAAATQEKTSADPVYARSPLDANTRARIIQKLDGALGNNVFEDNLLSLRSLSSQINEKPHLVSQVINQEYNANFYQLINKHRIQRAQSILLEEPSRTVLDVAYSVGFNSKTTFNTAFRKYVAMTPRSYRKTHLAGK